MSGKDIAKLVAACGVSLAAGAVGSLTVGVGGFRPWYAAIEKPAFTPPSWVFGPVWTILYILMGISAFLLWRRGLRSRAVRVALGWFLGQLALNALWSPVFFGWRRIGLALVVIVLLWAAVIATIYRFHRVSHVSAWLLAPYWLWVSFATVLNASIWWLNR